MYQRIRDLREDRDLTQKNIRYSHIVGSFTNRQAMQSSVRLRIIADFPFPENLQ